MVRVEHVLNSWKAVRRDTAAAVEEFPAGELDFRPTPEVDSFGQIALHILNAGLGLTGMLLAGEDDFTAPGFRDRMKTLFTSLKPEDGAAAIAQALRDSLDERAAAIAAKPPEFFSHLSTWFDGTRMTRLELVQFFKEHELAHRSQLFMYMRLKGLVPATTRRRKAAAAQAK